MSRSIERTNKEFLCDILRRAYITKDDASALYDMIHEECIAALREGKEVNLFGLVIIQPYIKNAHWRNTLSGEMMHMPKRAKLRGKIMPRVSKLWKEINED